ncbi:Uncharacterised protein [Mycobacterium tuberculosis]|uniref:Uncharacterized protein n=1 Tax=Mycobacterium tuberculosis TaxID=1773 RepID=A0A654U461_MYCTX|nr:Uncharacterised protein [Mycobacterium tuberculosis]
MLVTAADWASNDPIVGPCPANACSNCSLSALTCSGFSARNSGLNPPIRASRSNAGWVRANGIV